MKRIPSILLFAILMMIACGLQSPSKMLPTATPMSTDVAIFTATPTSTDVAISTATTKPEQELFSTNSFELNPLDDPPLWRFDARGSDAIGEWSTQTALSGQYSLSLKTSTAGTEQRGWPGWFSSTFSHEEGHGYHIQVMYYTTDGARPWLAIAFYDNQEAYLSAMSSGCSEQSPRPEWQPIELSVDANAIPAGTSQIRIELLQCLTFTEGTSTTLFYDDISVSPLTP